jgi:hypothetical protein
MAKNIYAVTVQTELMEHKDGEVIRRNHGGEFTESVIAGSPEAAVRYVREKHTSASQRVLRCGAHLTFAGVDQVPDATETPDSECVVEIPKRPVAPEAQEQPPASEAGAGEDGRE